MERDHRRGRRATRRRTARRGMGRADQGDGHQLEEQVEGGGVRPAAACLRLSILHRRRQPLVRDLALADRARRRGRVPSHRQLGSPPRDVLAARASRPYARSAASAGGPGVDRRAHAGDERARCVTGEAETRYARSGDAHIAYQVLGEGGPDLLYLSSGTISIDSIDEEPGFARFHRGLASFSRLIRMDLRGVGLSDPIDPSVPPSLEQWVGDALAVLDAVGSERAALCGADEGAQVAMLTAATHPTRTSALILLNAYARLRRDVDYPHGIPDHVVERFAATIYARCCQQSRRRRWSSTGRTTALSSSATGGTSPSTSRERATRSFPATSTSRMSGTVTRSSPRSRSS